MGRRRSLSITVDDRRKRLVLRGWKGGELAREAGCRPIYSGTVKGWILDADRLSDLVAYAEYSNVFVKVTEASDVA